MPLSLAQEELEIEYNSRFDYISEAYGETARDCVQMAEDDARYDAEEYWKPQESAFGPYIYHRHYVPLRARLKVSSPLTHSSDSVLAFGPYAPVLLPHAFNGPYDGQTLLIGR